MDSEKSTINMMIAHYSALAGVALLLLAGAVFYEVLSSPDAGFGAVASLVLVGLALFLGLMAIFSFISSWIGILDAKQAFGLPEGSVRAILTMAFIVIVGVLASYLITREGITSVATKSPLTIGAGLTFADAQTVAKSYPASEGIASIKKEGETYVVDLYPRVDSRLKEDVSKQILTMLSTILAAMIGFYFGARPGESDPDAIKRANAITSIEKVMAAKPDIKALASRARELGGAAARVPDVKARDDWNALAARLDVLEKAIEDADQARKSNFTTAAQMADAASAATKAADEIADAKTRIEKAGK